ncbi:MAG TPA: hypothetical protein VJR89_39630 [Polyangiales bacterium]|nr:hypothetical protein [Polyangiales bacterium]
MTNASKANKPTIPVLDPFSEKSAVPDWVRRKYPAYAEHTHTTGPVTSSRTIHAGGHEIEVRTTYEVRLDGQAVALNIMVDSDGRLWTHLCPYATFATAPELVEYVLEHAPEALVGLAHSGHEHSHADARRRS